MALLQICLKINFREKIIIIKNLELNKLYYSHHIKETFLTFPACFLNPINFNCSNLFNMRNLQEQVKKAFCYQKLFWPFTVRINCSSDLKNFANSRPSASNFKSFSRSLEHCFLTVGQNNFGNKIPFLISNHISMWTLGKYFCTVWSPII